jgi:hypothetical protein
MRVSDLQYFVRKNSGALDKKYAPLLTSDYCLTSFELNIF